MKYTIKDKKLLPKSEFFVHIELPPEEVADERDRVLENLKKEKYNVTIFYLFAYPIELLIERIKERAKKGGHMVSDEDVIRRYYRSACNFWNKYRFYASEWTIINNNQLDSEGIAVGSNGNFNIINDAEFSIFKEAVNHD